MTDPHDLDYEPTDAASPVRVLPGETSREPAPGIALCLSGGGYRAMLFHLGALWRLNETRFLSRLDRVSSVSGGSIAAGVLGLNWSRLDFGEDGVARAFDQVVTEPVRRLAGETLDVGSIVRGLLLPGSIAGRYAGALRRHVYGSATLADLPESPRFVINATNLQSAVLWRFSRPYMRDYRVGEVRNPRVELATAVAASSAFPPVLSPVVLELRDSDYTPGSGHDLQHEPYTTRVQLTDGGVYDNLGLETAWKRYRTILVSDGGGQIGGVPRPKRDWPRQTIRVLGVIDSQVRALRKRQTIAGFRRGDRDGAYWGIRTQIADYGLDDALPCPTEKTLALARVATRLAKTEPVVQERLVNWGYAVCDAALRRHVDSQLAPPVGFPYPDAGLG